MNGFDRTGQFACLITPGLVAARQVGKNTSCVTMLRIASAIIFQPWIGDVLDLSRGNNQIAFWFIPACLLLTAILTWRAIEDGSPNVVNSL